MLYRYRNLFRGKDFLGQRKGGAGVWEPMLNFMVDYDTGYGQYYGCGNHSQSCWLLGLPYCPHKSSWERHDQLERLVVDLHSSHEMFIVLCGNYHNEPPTFSKNPLQQLGIPQVDIRRRQGISEAQNLDEAPCCRNLIATNPLR